MGDGQTITKKKKDFISLDNKGNPWKGSLPELKRWWVQRFVRKLKICLFILVLAGFLLGLPPVQALSEDQQLVVEAWSLVNQSYVDPTFEGIPWRRLRQKALEQPISSREGAYEAIDAMLAPIGDPFTRFLRPEQLKALRDSTKGCISGVGLQLGINDGETAVWVLSSLEGSPAAAAGIRPGSVVLAVEGNSVKNLGLKGVAEALRGPSGTVVDIDLEAPDGGRQSLSLERRIVDLRPVHIRRLREDGHTYGLLQINQFTTEVPELVSTALAELQSKCIEGLILDLRNNPGGLVTSGLKVGDALLDAQPLVTIRDRNGIVETVTADDGMLYDGPLVVLINSSTASASEILAGALKDNERAEVLGRPTFGKGLIQTLIPLSDGSGLAVTVARYVTPDGYDIQKAGIAPNQVLVAATREVLEVLEDESQDPWLGRAMVNLQNQLHRHEKHVSRMART